jgi:hypothetical protein
VTFVVDSVALGQVPVLVLRFSRQYQSTNAPYFPLSTRFSYQKDKGAKPGKLTKRIAVSEIEEHWIENYFQYTSKCPPLTAL